MSKTAFVFPGQGSQKVGMGSDLLEARPELLEPYLEQADEASGLSVSKYALEGPLEELTRTDVAQPALFSVSLALFDLAREMGLRPDYVAGHSLGEYTAAVACGALSPEQGMPLVCERGRQMANIQDERPGTMAAVIGLPAERLEELCAEASAEGPVGLANLNTPVQIVVSGEDAGVSKLMELAQDEAEKVVPLQVGAAFHSELMEPVQSRLAEAMEELDWSDPDVPLVADYSGEAQTTGAAVRGALVEQIASPVRWVDCVRTLVGEGCATFLELGSGRVLGGLVRQIDGDVETFSADSPKKLDRFKERAAT